MKIVRLLSALAGMVMLTGCAGLFGQSDIDAINAASPTGTAFTQRLAREYRDFSNFEWTQMADYRDGQFFARKGLRAASGEAVPPESLQGWNIPPAMTAEMEGYRARLVQQIDNNATNRAPNEAAVAQARWDCWVEQQEEGWQTEDIAACRQEFLSALAALEGAARPAPAAAPPPQAGVYFVFFDFDRSNITPAGQQVIDSVIADARRTNARGIDVVGHTDTSGSPQYNEALSRRRAAAARESLVRAGISANAITTEARGETQPLVATGDGVREPSNRRAEIRLR